MSCRRESDHQSLLQIYIRKTKEKIDKDDVLKKTSIDQQSYFSLMSNRKFFLQYTIKRRRKQIRLVFLISIIMNKKKRQEGKKENVRIIFSIYKQQLTLTI